MINKDVKVLDTKTISSEQLERCDGTIKHIRNAWENLPEDLDVEEREMFIELASKLIKLHSLVKNIEKDPSNLN